MKGNISNLKERFSKVLIQVMQHTDISVSAMFMDMYIWTAAIIHQLTEIGFQIGTYERKPSSRLKPKSMSKIIKIIQKTWEKWASIFSCNTNKNNVVLTLFFLNEGKENLNGLKYDKKGLLIKVVWY